MKLGTSNGTYMMCVSLQWYPFTNGYLSQNGLESATRRLLTSLICAPHALHYVRVHLTLVGSYSGTVRATFQEATRGVVVTGRASLLPHVRISCVDELI